MRRRPSRLGPSGQYQLIQQAVNAAKSGDTVLVAPGTYTGVVQLIDKSITLKSSGGASQTILDANYLSVVLDINTNSDVQTVVDGFTITHGMSSSIPADGGAFIYGGGATLKNNIFLNNHGYNVDATQNSAVVMLNNTVSTATTENGLCIPAAGVLISGTLKDINGNVIVDDISGNAFTGDGTTCSGPAVQISGVTSATVENNIITGTTLAISVDAASSIIRQNAVFGNQSGGLYVDVAYTANAATGGNTPEAGPATAVVVNNSFYNNLSRAGAAEVVLDKQYARIAMYNNIVASNNATLPALSCTSSDTTANLTPPVLDHNDFVNS